MNSKERDEVLTVIKDFFDDGGLISRLDERTLNYAKDLSDMNKHLKGLNGHILELWKQTSSNKTSIKWIIRIGGAAGIIGGATTGIMNWLG